jgi:6-phosphogluconate dehydrogenase
MQIGLIGLGKMGMNMSQRLAQHGHHEVFGFDTSPDKLQELEGKGGRGADSLDKLLSLFTQSPKVIWIMVPAGAPVDATVTSLIPHLCHGDIIIDGGNSYYRDSVRRSQSLAAHGIKYLDAGTSGGVWGLENGYCLMVGGDQDAYKTAEPIFAALAPTDGLVYTGASGSGHYTKMVHNGIEYGLLQAYGEGFEILGASEYDLNLLEISKAWRYGSVVRSWLLDLLVNSFEADPHLEHVKGYVEDSGEGRWTIQEAIDHNVAAPIITLSLFERFHSRKPDAFSAKVIASLRNQFGGHAVKHESVADATGSGGSTIETGVSQASMGVTK